MDNFVYKNNALDCDHFFRRRFTSYPLLNPQTSAALFVCARDLNIPKEIREETRDNLICSNLRLVYDVLRKMGFSPSMDNVMNGIEGLIHAVDKYNTSLGIQFSTYAYKYIYYAILGTQETTSFHITSTLQKDLRKVDKAEKALIVQLGRMPAIQELVQETGLSEEKVEEIIRLRHQRQYTISLSTPNEDGIELRETLADEADMEEQILTRTLCQDLLKLVSPEEARVLRMYHFAEMSYAEIAKRLDKSPERIRQIACKARKKIENNMAM